MKRHTLALLAFASLVLISAAVDITLPTPPAEPAKPARVFSKGWISSLTISAIPTPGSTNRPTISARIVLTGKTEDTGEFAPAGTEQVYVISDIEAAAAEVPALGVAMQAIFQGVNAWTTYAATNVPAASTNAPTN